MSEITDDHMGFISDELEAIEMCPYALEDFMERQASLAINAQKNEAAHARREVAYQLWKKNRDQGDLF